MRKRLRQWMKVAPARLFGVGMIASLVLGFCAMRTSAVAQVAYNAAAGIPDINTGQASGTSPVLRLDGNYSNCTVVAYTSVGTATIDVYGNFLPGQYGPSAPNNINANFGSSGVITATTTQTPTQGNTSNLPVGIYFTWSGNSGTLHVWLTCTGASSGSGTINGQVGINNTPTVVPSCPASSYPCGFPTPPPTPSILPSPASTLPVTTPPPPNPAATCTPRPPGTGQSAGQSGICTTDTNPTPTPQPTACPTGSSPQCGTLHYNQNAALAWSFGMQGQTSVVLPASQTTTQILAGSSSLYTYIWGVTIGGNSVSSVTAALKTGQGSTCGTNTVTYATETIATTTTSAVVLWGTNQVAGQFTFIWAPIPIPLPANATPYNACVTISGASPSSTTTVYLLPMTWPNPY